MLQRRVPGSVLLWSLWHSLCRLGCKHFSVVAHALLQVSGPSVVALFCQDTNIADLLTSVWFHLMYHCRLNFSTQVSFSVASLLLDRIPYKNSFNLLDRFQCRKSSESTVNKTGRISKVGGVEEGDRMESEIIHSAKKTAPRPRCHDQ